MRTTDRDIHQDAAVAKETIVVPVITETGLTAAEIFNVVPGYAFEVEKVESFCRTKAGAVDAEVRVGGVAATAAGVAFTAATRVDNAIHATPANVRGVETDAITVELTTDGTGALSNGFIVLTIRPRPLAGDPRIL